MPTLLGASVLSLLSACTVGPDYTPPDASTLTPESWSSNDPTDPSAGIAEWWTNLGDAELTALITRAFETSLTLAEARERIIAARARRGIENADRLPTLDAQASYTRSQTGDDGFVLGGAPAGAEVDIYSLGALAGWELDLWGRVDRLVEAADADIQFAVEDLRASRVALAAEVAREVILIRATDRDIAIVESTVATSQDALDIAQARAGAGFGDDLDVARARRDLESNLALLPALRADRRDAELRLAVLLGAPPGQIALSNADMPHGNILPHRGVPADLLLRRPDLRQAERQLAAATARIGAATAERFPRVTLSGSIALQGPDLGDTVKSDTFVLSAGPSVSLPIFQGGRIRARVLQAESEQRQALIRLQALVIDALSEVETASMRRAKTLERTNRLRDAEAAALDAERLASDRYTAGQVDFLDVTEARQSRLAIERTRVAAERDTLLQVVDLYTSLGGGWTDDPGPAGPSQPASDQPPQPLALTAASPP